MWIWIEICSFIHHLRTRNRTRNNRNSVRTSLLLIFQCKIKLINNFTSTWPVCGRPIGKSSRRPSVLLHKTGTDVYTPVISLYVVSVLLLASDESCFTGLFYPTSFSHTGCFPDTNLEIWLTSLGRYCSTNASTNSSLVVFDFSGWNRRLLSNQQT